MHHSHPSSYAPEVLFSFFHIDYRHTSLLTNQPVALSSPLSYHDFQCIPRRLTSVAREILSIAKICIHQFGFVSTRETNSSSAGLIFIGLVVMISACHESLLLSSAGDRGSIPRWRVILFVLFVPHRLCDAFYVALIERPFEILKAMREM